MAIYNIEYLNEITFLNEDSILKGPQFPHSITIKPDRNKIVSFKNEPYFKYFEGQDTSEGQPVIRIAIKEPKIVNHNNMLDSWNFKGKHKKELIETLNLHVQSLQNPDGFCRVWDNLLFNLATRWINVDYNLIKDWLIPNYMLLPSVKGGRMNKKL